MHPGPFGWQTKTGGDPNYPGRCAWTAPARPQQPPRVNHYHHPDELLHGDKSATGDDEPP